MLTYPQLDCLGNRKDPGNPSQLKMPRTPRHLFLLLICSLSAAACFAAASGEALAQVKTGTQAAKEKGPTPAKKTQPPVQGLGVPGAESTVILIRSTLLSLNDAMETGNYTVLRDLPAPSFREANSAGRLYQIFASLEAQHVSLAAVAILVPKLPQALNIDANGRLHISGYFPGDPVQLNFDLLFEAVAGRWRLFGTSVNPIKLSGAAVQPQAGLSGKAGEPARQPKSAR